MVLTHLFEDVHIGMFLTMIFFISNAVVCAMRGHYEKQNWKNLETVAQNMSHALLESKKQEKRGAFGMFRSIDLVTYYLIREQFLHPLGGTPGLEDFEFGRYLELCLSETLWKCRGKRG